MSRWLKVMTGVTGALAGGVGIASVVAGRLWQRETEQLVEALERARTHSAPVRYDPAELVGLPPPVVRYFELALTPGQPIVHGARIEHTGEFRGGLDADWRPFRSAQWFNVDPPGFVWDATIAMAPLVSVRVRDRYLRGRAGMLGRVAALVTVVDQRDTPELASSALHRSFAERVWLPTSLLPSQGVRWEAIDDSTARATLSDGDITVSFDAHFGPGGEIERVTMLRYRDADGVGIPTPFEGRFSDYHRLDGMLLPVEGEVAWILPEGRLDYWRGRITAVDYDLAR
jgi:hypothetical protein